MSTAGCGGRTSTLDPDAYALGPETVSTGGSGGTVDLNPIAGAGKPSSGGLPGTGAASSGTQGGASGVDQKLAVQPCQQYCAGYATQCASRLQGRACQPSCEGEVNASGPVCQVLGIQTLNCLAPFFNAKGGACDPAVNRALTSCGPLLSAFGDCEKVGNAGAGQPQPPRPRVDIASCTSVGTSGTGSECMGSFNCAGGSYQTLCSTSPSGLQNCLCIRPDGTQSMAQLKPSPDVCYDAFSACN